MALGPLGADPVTPYLQVDVDRLQRNLDRTAARFAEAGVALRPHAKTHKCPEVARRQLAAGAVGLTVATIGEAEAMVAAGCHDVFVAYPLWLDERGSRRLADLATQVTVAIGVDSAEGAANAGRLLDGSPVEVLVEVDSGQHRSGAAPADAGAVAVAARRAGLEVRGVFTFPGHGYGAERSTAARDEAAALWTAGEAMAAAGVEPRVLSGGSTPTLADADLDVLTEARPGVYAFHDAQQWELGVVGPEDLALVCVSTVISHAGGRVVLDAGSKALGADRAAYATGFGRLPDHPDARVVQLSEHHAVVDLAGAPLPPLGSTLAVAPNHVCAAINLHDELWVDSPRSGRSAWPVTARGRNS
ncbi:alanine racemase [Nocardioides pantholopis]|uniref:alanine racemase n=1 Tax=Nocardioides pantholopis TaxID=2483798 RepID=UPI000FDA1128|nr:alanine racemase [Nocardioides pantholopis]